MIHWKKDPKHAIFLILVGIFLILTAPTLFTRSMFMDGLYYASIARNLAEGIGSFWNPYFTEFHFPVFHEHPPLALWVQSLLFRVLGDAFWVDRLYGLLLYILIAYFMVSIWKKADQQTHPDLPWLPLLFGLSIPLFWWGVSNNVLENSMMLFTLLAVRSFVEALRSPSLLYSALGGLMIFLGALCKGPVALFPLAFFFWAFCFTPTIKLQGMLRNTLVALLGVMIPLALLLFVSEPAYDALKDYFMNQVLQGVSERSTVDSRFYIAKRLFDQSIPALSILGVGVLINRWKGGRGSVEKGEIRRGGIFLATGLSGVLPIMISKTQGGFYMLPALPLFCIAFSFFLKPLLTPFFRDGIWSKKSLWGVWTSAMFLLISGIGLHIHFFGKGGADGKKIELVERVEALSDKRLISVDPALWNDFGLHAYLQRYGRISMDRRKQEQHGVLLLPKNGGKMEDIPASFVEKESPHPSYRLYHREAK